MGYTQSAFSSIEYWMAAINVCEIPAGPIPSISNIYALDNKYHFNKINFHFEFYGPSHFIYFHRWKWTEQQSFLRDDRTFEFVAESTLNASSWLNPIKIHAHTHTPSSVYTHSHHHYECVRVWCCDWRFSNWPSTPVLSGPIYTFSPFVIMYKSCALNFQTFYSLNLLTACFGGL